MSEHSPGPWKLLVTHEGIPYDLIGADRMGVIRLRSICRPTTENGKANAHLIAAAPDLMEELKACKSLLAQINGFMFGMKIRDYEDRINARLDSSRTVIAKAEGKTR